MTIAEEVEFTTTKPKNSFEGMLDAIRESLSDLGSSNDEDDGEDETDDEDDTELHKLSKDDKPGWVIGTISKPIQ